MAGAPDYGKMRTANGNWRKQDMEITVNTQVIGIGVIIIIAIIVAHIAQVRRTGKLPTRDEFNALSEKVSDLEVTVATSVAALNARIDALPTQESLDAAIRASEARIIKALINHRHPEPSGAPVFTEPL